MCSLRETRARTLCLKPPTPVIRANFHFTSSTFEIIWNNLTTLFDDEKFCGVSKVN